MDLSKISVKSPRDRRVNSPRPLEKTGSSLALFMTNVTSSAVDNWLLRNKFNELWQHNTKNILEEMITLQNVFCKMTTMLLRPQCVSTLRARQNGRHFADDVFKCLFLTENFWISDNISLKYVHRLKLTKCHLWRRKGLVLNRRQAFFWTNDGLVYWRIFASPCLNVLTAQIMDGHYSDEETSSKRRKPV